MNSAISKHRYIILFSTFLYFLFCKHKTISSNEVNQTQEEININSINCAVPMAPNLKISFLEYLSKIIISICEEINISIDQNNFKEKYGTLILSINKESKYVSFTISDTLPIYNRFN